MKKDNFEIVNYGVLDCRQRALESYIFYVAGVPFLVPEDFTVKHKYKPYQLQIKYYPSSNKFTILSNLPNHPQLKIFKLFQDEIILGVDILSNKHFAHFTNDLVIQTSLSVLT